MPRQASLFADDQPDMFAAPAQSVYTPNPDKVRARLVKLLAEARAAQPNDWEPSTLSLYRTIFPQMARFLGEEGAVLLGQFESELARLDPPGGLNPAHEPPRPDRRRLVDGWLGAVPAAAQDVEQVTVYGGTLAGIWKTSGPSWIQMSLFGTTTWGPNRPNYCRITFDAQGYVTNCFGYGDAGRGGNLETDGRHFHLAWGTMMARLVLDGEVQTGTRFTGHFAIKLAGISVTNPGESTGEKISPGLHVVDAAGKADVVRAILSGNAPPHDDKLNGRIAAAQGLKLGAVQEVLYLGRLPKASGPDDKEAPDPDYLSVYAVEFDQGERLCLLHQDADGKLAAFQCV